MKRSAQEVGGVRQEDGIYFSLLALFIVVLVGFAALVVGLGYISTDKTRLQNALNLAAMGAVEAYVRSNEAAHTAARCAEARDRANFILGQNRLPGVQGKLGDLEHACMGGGGGSGGTMHFGAWLTEKPHAVSDPCSGKYPCFVNLDNGSAWDLDVINAVRIDGQTQSGNELIVGLTRIFGADRFRISASATAAVVPRCLVMLLDASLSTTQETHFHEYHLVDKTLNQARLPMPNRYGLFAIRIPPGEQWDCNNVSPGDAYRMDKLSYCNLKEPANLNRGGNQDPTRHYYSDYLDSAKQELRYDTARGRLLVDGYMSDQAPPFHFGAEPLSRYFLAFNVALRRLLRESSGEDRAELMVFRGSIDPAADVAPAGGLSRQFDDLVALTNITHRVITDAAAGTRLINATGDHFVKRGWVPLWSKGQDDAGNTNIVGALRRAIHDLTNRNLPNACPAEARRVIILATDGVMTCSEPKGGTHTCGIPSGGNSHSAAFDVETSPGLEPGTYLMAEQQLLGDPVGEGSSILHELQASEIALTVMLDGSHVQPNIINAKTADGKRWIDESNAYGEGFRGRPTGTTDKPFVNSTPGAIEGESTEVPVPTCTESTSEDAFAFDHNSRAEKCTISGAAKYYRGIFRRVNGVFAEMSLQTGGVWCPLMDLYGPECAGSSPPGYCAACDQGMCYEPDPDNAACGCACKPGDPGFPNCCSQKDDQQACIWRLKDSVRTAIGAGNPLYRSPKLLSKSAQAAECAVRSIGATPFGLVEVEE